MRNSTTTGQRALSTAAFRIVNSLIKIEWRGHLQGRSADKVSVPREGHGRQDPRDVLRYALNHEWELNLP